MLVLSGRYASAATAAEQRSILAAGEALLAIEDPNMPFGGIESYVSLLLVTLASVIIAAMMVRSKVFSRATGFIGLVAEGAQLSFFVVLAAAPSLAALPPSVAGFFRLIWYLMIGWRLWQVGRVQ
jgi:hypothetical protein